MLSMIIIACMSGSTIYVEKVKNKRHFQSAEGEFHGFRSVTVKIQVEE